MPESFEWKQEYDTFLEQIAMTDQVVTDWTQLRAIIKYKVDKIVSQYLELPPSNVPAPANVPSSPKSMPMGGLKLPPFSSRGRPDSNSNNVPKHILTEKETSELKADIFKQLDEFEGPPFTIQRLCELCLNPQKHYTFVGKYLRALDKVLLVTSTWDTFPVPTSTSNAKTLHKIPLVTHSAVTPSAPSTPMFSPIPFLHSDARRSHSRSPPPSPLVLGRNMAEADGTEPKALGLVDELDDPSPGHLSDRPQPLSATTTTEGVKPEYKSLDERFTRAKEVETSQNAELNDSAGQTSAPTTGDMVVSEEELGDKGTEPPTA